MADLAPGVLRRDDELNRSGGVIVWPPAAHTRVAIGGAVSARLLGPRCGVATASHAGITRGRQHQRILQADHLTRVVAVHDRDAEETAWSLLHQNLPRMANKVVDTVEA